MTQSAGGGAVERLRQSGVPVDALDGQLIRQLEVLTDEEVRILVSIKEKLNAGLDDRMRLAAGNVGGFIW